MSMPMMAFSRSDGHISVMQWTRNPLVNFAALLGSDSLLMPRYSSTSQVSTINEVTEHHLAQIDVDDVRALIRLVKNHL